MKILSFLRKHFPTKNPKGNGWSAFNKNLTDHGFRKKKNLEGETDTTFYHEELQKEGKNWTHNLHLVKKQRPKGCSKTDCQQTHQKEDENQDKKLVNLEKLLKKTEETLKELQNKIDDIEDVLATLDFPLERKK